MLAQYRCLGVFLSPELSNTDLQGSNALSSMLLSFFVSISDCPAL